MDNVISIIANGMRLKHSVGKDDEHGNKEQNLQLNIIVKLLTKSEIHQSRNKTPSKRSPEKKRSGPLFKNKSYNSEDDIEITKIIIYVREGIPKVYVLSDDIH